MIQRDQQLLISGISAEQLADEHGTPLYVYDKETIERQYRKLEKAFGSRYENFSIYYAMKANTNPSIIETLADLGAGLDCASKAEIQLASEMTDQDSILYTAPFNKKEELEFAVDKQVTLNLDGSYLFEKFDSEDLDFPEKVCFRVDPGFGKGKNGLSFAGEGSKFGVEQGEVAEAFREAKRRGAEEFGIHVMAGSCVLEPEYFEQITERLLDIAGKVKNELEIEFEFINIGGGFGVDYEPDEEPLDIEETAEKVTRVFKQKIDEYNLDRPELMIEPGSYLVAESGVLLTEVAGMKQKGDKTFIGVDTGMHHFLDPALLGAYREIVVANDLEREKESEKDVVGPVCSSKDVLAEDRMLPEIQEGDVLGIMKTGAYGFSMASHWNSRPLPAEVIVEDGKAELIREREYKEAVFHGTKIDN